MFNNKITEQLDIQYPIIQAPMAGGVTTSELVSEVSHSGGLGSIGAGYMTPRELQKQIQEIKQLTTNTYSVNLFVPIPLDVTQDEMNRANDILQPIREELNIQPNDNLEIPTYENELEKFHEQVQVLMKEKVPVCSFTFGIPSSEMISELKKHNIILVGTATTVREAIENEQAGMDIVVVQGSEAGGHRGSFTKEGNENLIGLMSLIPQVVDHVSIPVVAAGGIMDGRGLMAALSLGAEGVQMGTAFLTCEESGANDIHKEEILHAHEDQTVLTRSFSGKWARGIKNRYISEMQDVEESFPEFPIQNTLTKGIRSASSSQQNRDFMSIWSGQSPRLAKKQTVNELMKEMIKEAKQLKEKV
jgi:nitronate monooxygenase